MKYKIVRGKDGYYIIPIKCNSNIYLQTYVFFNKNRRECNIRLKYLEKPHRPYISDKQLIRNFIKENL